MTMGVYCDMGIYTAAVELPLEWPFASESEWKSRALAAEERVSELIERNCDLEGKMTAMKNGGDE